MGGYFSAVPMHVREGLTATSLLVRGAPWQPPPLYGLLGARSTAPDERVLLISNETPIPVLPVLKPLDKADIERLHIDKFCTDWLLAVGQRPYEEELAGPDPSLPPDFRCIRNGRTVGVDCVQFAVTSRRRVNGRFATIKRLIYEANPRRFAHLAGLLVFVWVEDVDSPIKRAEPELLEALEKYRFDPGDGRTVGLAMPENAPSLGISDTDSGWRFYGTPLLVSAPASQFFSRLGFEMAFVFNSEHTAREGWDDFQQRIEQHDKAEIQDVVVTVGGPDRFGYTHPSEEAIFDLMLDDVRWSYAPQWTERVFAHGWESGRILQVHPTVELVSAGLFQGWVPAHQPLVPR